MTRRLRDDHRRPSRAPQQIDHPIRNPSTGALVGIVVRPAPWKFCEKGPSNGRGGGRALPTLAATRKTDAAAQSALQARFDCKKKKVISDQTRRRNSRLLLTEEGAGGDRKGGKSRQKGPGIGLRKLGAARRGAGYTGSLSLPAQVIEGNFGRSKAPQSSSSHPARQFGFVVGLGFNPWKWPCFDRHSGGTWVWYLANFSAPAKNNTVVIKSILPFQPLGYLHLDRS